MHRIITLLHFCFKIRDHPFKTSANFRNFWPLPPPGGLISKSIKKCSFVSRFHENKLVFNGLFKFFFKNCRRRHSWDPYPPRGMRQMSEMGTPRPPTVLCIAVKVAVFYEIDSKLWLFLLPYASLCLGNYLDQSFEKFFVDWWPFYLTEPDESPLVEEKVKKTSNFFQ